MGARQPARQPAGQFITRKELAQREGVSIKTIDNWQRCGYLDIRRVGPRTHVRVRLTIIRARQ